MPRASISGPASAPTAAPARGPPGQDTRCRRRQKGYVSRDGILLCCKPPASEASLCQLQAAKSSGPLPRRPPRTSRSCKQGRRTAPLWKRALRSLSLSNWQANSCRASYSPRLARQRDFAAGAGCRRLPAGIKKGPRQGRGQFDREEVNAMADAAVHRTLHCALQSLTKCIKESARTRPGWLREGMS